MRYFILSALLTTSASSLAAPPTSFSESGKNLVAKGGTIFRISQALSGRGQVGLANFYSDGRNEYLIKEDEPGTCLLEGSAQFVREARVLPKALENAVNYASAGSITSKDGKKPLIISIQERVSSPIPGAQIKPWDIVVFGQKRDPKTLSSFESKYPKEIMRAIAGARPYARWRLAAAILSSALAGDESLHVGQFMSALDVNQNILDILRIDLGARERFAFARNNLKQLSPYHASALYQKSGQFSKDYVSYLLAEKSLLRAYNMLWARLFVDKKKYVESLTEKSNSLFLEQLGNLPQGAQEIAIKEVLAVVNKGTKEKDAMGLTTQDPGAGLAKRISELDKERANIMIDAGNKEHQSDQIALAKSIDAGVSNSEEKTRLLRALQFSDKLMAESAQGAKEETLANAAKALRDLQSETYEWADKAVRTPASTGLFEKMAIYGEAGLNLAEALYLATGAANNAFEDAVRMFQSVMDVATFCVDTSSKSRKQAGAILIQGLLGGITELKLALINKERISAITVDKGIISNSPNKKGERLIKAIRSRYLLPPK